MDPNFGANFVNAMTQFASFLPQLQTMAQNLPSTSTPLGSNSAQSPMPSQAQQGSQAVSPSSTLPSNPNPTHLQAQAPIQTASNLPNLSFSAQPSTSQTPPTYQAPHAQSLSTVSGSSFSTPHNVPSSSNATQTNATSLADVFEATTSPAPIRPYSSLQMLGAVAGSSTTEGSASNPFGGGSRPTGGSGFPSLTQLANRQRIEHAHETLPRKKRGKAIKPPSLLGESYKPKVEDCLRMAQSGEVVINLDVFVLPPQPPQAERREFNIPQHLYRYLIHQTSFRAILGGLKLTFSFSNLRISTTVGELLKHIADRLRCHGYVLNERSPPPFGAIHESLPLRLLAYSNLGRVSGNNKTPRLVPANVMAEATIADIVRNPRDFAIPKWAVSDRSTFELHAIIQSPVLEIRASLSSLGLGNDMVEQMHQCISRRLYGAFRNDSDAVDAEGWDALVNDATLEDGCGHGGESQGQEDAEEEGVVAQSLVVFEAGDFSPLGSRVTSRSTSAPSSSLMLSRATRTRQAPTILPTSRSASGSSVNSFSSRSTSGSSINSFSSSSSDSFPPLNQRALLGANPGVMELWSNTCIESWEREKPTISTQMDHIYDFERPGQVFDTITTNYARIQGSALHGLELRGQSTRDLAKQLEALLITAVAEEDFSKLFSSTRHFILLDEAGDYITSGPGIERETIFILNRMYLKEREMEFFTRKIDDFATLATVPERTARLMSEEKKTALSVLGAVVSLSLVYGIGTEPLNPILLIYCYSNCDLRSASEALVREWHPALHQTLKSWLSTGPDDNVQAFASHFATYHETSVDSLTGRTLDMHRSLGWDMLHNTIIGPEPISHPYFEAFHKGLMMASAGDQTIAQFAHAFVGGPEKFVASTYACYIRSYDSLRLEYQIELEEAAVTNLEALITSQPTLKATNFIGVIREFLEGQGAPYSQLLQEVKERFHSLVDLDEISQKSFRMRMFNWAVTGTPHVLQDGPAITIRLVEDNDVEYLSGVPLARQPAYIGLGVCKFRTCSRTIHIPASYLIGLLKREYSSEPEADNAAKAVHHWLLVSILDNVGENNVA